MIAFALGALARAAAFAAEAVAALLIAAAALILAAIGLIALILSHAAHITADMLRALGGISNELVKVALVAILIIVVVWSFPTIWVAYRGDIPALLPAAVTTLLPIAYATTFKPIWSGLVFAITAAGLAGIIVPHLHPIALALLAGGARAVGVLQNLDQEMNPWTAKPNSSSGSSSTL